MAKVMRSIEAQSGKEGEVFIKIGGRRYNCMHVTEIEALVEYEKGEVKRLGARMTGHKINGMAGTYKGKGYYRFDELRMAAEAYKNGAAAPIYEIEITNYDKSSTAGLHRVVLKDCMPDSDVLAKVNAGEEFLEEDIEGTFDDFEIVKKFSSNLDGYIEGE